MKQTTDTKTNSCLAKLQTWRNNLSAAIWILLDLNVQLAVTPTLHRNMMVFRTKIPVNHGQQDFRSQKKSPTAFSMMEIQK